MARLGTLGLQIAQSRSYLCTLGPKVSIIYILGALGEGAEHARILRSSLCPSRSLASSFLWRTWPGPWARESELRELTAP